MTVVTSRGFFASQAIAARHSIGCAETSHHALNDMRLSKNKQYSQAQAIKLYPASLRPLSDYGA